MNTANNWFRLQEGGQDDRGGTTTDELGRFVVSKYV